MLKQDVTRIRDPRILMTVFLSLIISSFTLGWTIALRERKKEGTSMLAGILTNSYMDILISAAVFLYPRYFLGKLLGRENLESIGIPPSLAHSYRSYYSPHH
ncbi:hypothetical protein [Thermococcus sp.]|uniref:hypothetical protein n=1 Tax=Thermococcus sp. TaxID=35749 RepID=UPI0025F98DAB|nr:hypothetical protein [Thermococcus sp.]